MTIVWRSIRLLGLSAALLVSACDNHASNAQQAPSRTLSESRESGELVVLTRNAPTTRYIGRDGEPAGPEHDLATAFGDWLGVDVAFRYRDSIGAVLDGVENAEGDLAAAGLTITPARRDRFRFGPAYQPVTQQVACRRDNVQPEEVADLAGLDIRVITDSSYAERLRGLEEAGHSASNGRPSRIRPPRNCCAASGSASSIARSRIRASSTSIAATSRN